MSDVQSDNFDWTRKTNAKVSSNAETIPINLSDSEWEVLISTFIQQAFLPVSVETFNEALASGTTHTEAVMAALRNEVANDALMSIIGEQLTFDFEQGVREFEEACVAVSLQMKSNSLNDQLDIDSPPMSMLTPLTLIWVSFRKEGIHCYPAAATDPTLASGDQYDVSFLAHPHRHIFHFRVGIQVFHDDRDIEFIQFKRWIEGLYSTGALELNHKSCEMLAQDLHEIITVRYPGRKMSIDVSEDGENGATIVYFHE